MTVLTRNTPPIIAWIGLATHLAVGVAALRRPSGLPPHPLLPLLNLAVALCVLAYWATKWYGYLVRGITWYASDQLIPLYALAVAVISGLALVGWYEGRLAHWIVFAIDALTLAAAALYFAVARFDRLF